MAHGNRKRKASDGFRRSKCEQKAELREYLEGQVRGLVGDGLSVLSIVRELDGLAKHYRIESRGRH